MNQTKTIQLIHLAFCIAVLAFGILAVTITRDTLFFAVDFNNGDPLIFIAPLFAISSMVISTMLFNTLIGKIGQDLTTTEKIMQYQTAFLVKCAFLEGAALFNIVTCLVTSNGFTLIFAAACLVMLWLGRPTTEKIYNTLQIQDTNSF